MGAVGDAIVVTTASILKLWAGLSWVDVARMGHFFYLRYL